MIDDFIARVDRAVAAKAARRALQAGGDEEITGAFTAEGLGSRGGPMATGEGTWTCPACGLIFESRQQCFLHMRAMHLQPEPKAVPKPAPAELLAEPKPMVRGGLLTVPYLTERSRVLLLTALKRGTSPLPRRRAVLLPPLRQRPLL